MWLRRLALIGAGIAVWMTLVACSSVPPEPGPVPPPPAPIDPDFRSLSSGVEVRRDTWGIPHIFAHRSDDGLFVLGYETARDRLFQMDYNRHRTQGRLAEWFGAASLDDDRLVRTLGFTAQGQAGEDDLRRNDPEIHRALSAYAAGVSAFIDDATQGRHGARLPPELAAIDPAYRPLPWTVVDSLALLKGELFVLAAHPDVDLLAYASALTSPVGKAIYRDLFEPDPLEPIFITPGFPAGCPAGAATGPGSAPASGAAAPSRLARPHSQMAPEAMRRLAARFTGWSGRRRAGPTGASNNIVLCGRLTRSGSPLLENDPHLNTDLPSNFYELHLDSDEPGRELHMAGFGLAGLPAVALGHNRDAAWGVTTGEDDIADTFLETLSQSGSDAVLFKGRTVAMRVHTETVRVRRTGRPVSDYTEVTQKVRTVPHHGPVISDASPDIALLLGTKQVISLQWVGFGVTHEARAFYDLARVTSFEEFRAALNHFEAGLFNFVYAGTDGEIGYYPHALYPIRARLDPANPPYAVLPGTGDHEWTGQFIPDVCIPQASSPSSCRIFSANNDPAGVSSDRDVLNDAYYLGGTFDYGLRARRLSDRLDGLAAGDVQLADLESIQGDVHSGVAEHFLPPLLQAAPAANLSSAAAELLSHLAGWDRTDRTDAVAPTIFAAYYAQLLVDVFAPALPLTFAQLATDDRHFASLLQRLLRGETAPSGFDYLGSKSPAAVMTAALETVAQTLAQELGPDVSSWTWGRAHTVTLAHPLGQAFSLGPMAVGGGLSSLDAARYAPVVDGKATAQPAVFEAPNARILVELTPAKVTMRAAIMAGESGVPGDPHFQDQLSMWLSARTRPAYFEPGEVKANSGPALMFPAGFPDQGSPAPGN
jgi:penicillin amidase